MSRGHRAAAVQFVVLLEQVIAWFIVDLEQPLQEEITLTRGTPAVLAELPSTPTREVSGSFPNSFSRLQWSRSSLADDKPSFFHDVRLVQSVEPALDQVFVTYCHRIQLFLEAKLPGVRSMRSHGKACCQAICHSWQGLLWRQPGQPPQPPRASALHNNSVNCCSWTNRSRLDLQRSSQGPLAL